MLTFLRSTASSSFVLLLQWLWSTNKNLRQYHGNIKSSRYLFISPTPFTMYIFMVFRSICEKLFTAIGRGAWATAANKQYSRNKATARHRTVEKTTKQSNEIKLSSSWSFSLYCRAFTAILCVFYDGKNSMANAWDLLSLLHLIAFSIRPTSEQRRTAIALAAPKVASNQITAQTTTYRTKWMIERMESNSRHECISTKFNAHKYDMPVDKSVNTGLSFIYIFFCYCQNHYDWNTNIQQFFLSRIAMQSKFVHNKSSNLKHVISCKIALYFPPLFGLCDKQTLRSNSNNYHEQLYWKPLNACAFAQQGQMKGFHSIDKNITIHEFRFK